MASLISLSADEESVFSSPTGPEPAAQGTEDFIPVLWDPVHLLATEFLNHSWQPVHDRVRDALTVVMELGGAGNRSQIREEELAAFYCVLAKAVCGRVRLSSASRAVFLQVVASAVYYRLSLRGFSGTRAFWEFLREREAEYTAAIRVARDTKPLITITDHFLCHFGLGGSDNIDVVYGLYRFLSPLLGAATRVLRDQEVESWGPESLSP